ncbi:MAG: hypothetical protein NC040_01460 [Muribaculaceae bacterium]|nr:hypothetical protein [Alistipes senegalensis]MCM1472696.1 hypothetical protein [Muribaculaceae bacterium]
MACKFRKILNIFLIFVMMMFTACGNTTKEITPEISAESNMDKVLFFVTILHNYQEEKYTDTDIMYYFVVLSDGTVWTMDSNYRDDNYDFVKKFSGHDESAWEIADHLENIGNFSPEDTQKLSEYISGINYDAKDYDRLRDDGCEPDVIESIYYDYSCCIPDDKRNWFRIMNTGANQCISYKTYDENALSALSLVRNNHLYTDWTEKINK